MQLDHATCYRALLAYDARYDGAFYVGVSSTKIYCRTICPAKTPRAENCTFYRSAAAAEEAGYRPCLRCRPELAPGNAVVDSTGRLAALAASRIEDGALTDSTVDELAAEIGITGRHLRRVIESEFGVSPISLAQTQRLLLAKRLLTDTNLTVTDVAFASGFSSLRRFNALFSERYRMSPTGLRKSRNATANVETLRFELAYRLPYDWTSIIDFLSADVIRGVESITSISYARTVRIGKSSGWLYVARSATRNALTVDISASLAPVLIPLLARVKRLFDLAAEPLLIGEHLGKVAELSAGLRVPGAFDGFEMAVRAILGQQVSVKAASTLAGRFATTFGEPCEPNKDDLTHLSPTAERVAQLTREEVSKLGILPARANSLIELAKAVVEKRVDLEPVADVEEAIKKLKQIPGIGDWTAHYIAMRALRWPDAFPHTDLAIYKALGETNPRKVLAQAEAWRPWRAYAAMHLWKSLETRL